MRQVRCTQLQIIAVSRYITSSANSHTTDTIMQHLAKSAVMFDAQNTPLAASPARRSAITAAQKQSLMDNLQLEGKTPKIQTLSVIQLTRSAVTERARRLRSEYGLQSQNLRSRLEMRINRIPRALRTANIEELVEKYSQSLEEAKRKPATKAAQHAYQLTSSSPSRARGVKRSSYVYNFGSKPARFLNRQQQ
jgi:hypothetical protein